MRQTLKYRKSNLKGEAVNRNLLIVSTLALVLFVAGWTQFIQRGYTQEARSPFVIGQRYGDEKNYFTVLEDRGGGWFKVRGKWPGQSKDSDFLLNTNHLQYLQELK